MYVSSDDYCLIHKVVIVHANYLCIYVCVFIPMNQFSISSAWYILGFDISVYDSS